VKPRKPIPKEVKYPKRRLRLEIEELPEESEQVKNKKEPKDERN
jgi:hypothetical protein